MSRLGYTVMATALVLALAGCATSGVGMERSEGVRVARSQPLVQSRPLALLASAMRVAPETVARSAAEPRMLRASLRIPAIRMGVVQVVPYRGLPDDGPGTRIQNGGIAASPFGNDGGVGPGQVGNYIVTAHRTTTPAPFADLPALDRGEHVLVTAGGQIFDYRVTETRSTSFRSKRSLARQAAAVPGHQKMAAPRPAR